MALPQYMLFSVLILLSVTLVRGQESDSEPEDDCQRLDLTFIVDSSGSICDHDKTQTTAADGSPTCGNWKLVQGFMKNIVGRFEIGKDNVQVAAVVFGNHGRLIWNLTRYSTAEELDGAIDELPYRKQNTNTSGGLWVAYNEVYDPSKGDRGGAPNIVILITDGVSTKDNNLTIPNADALKRDKRVTIFSVGVTKKINEEELKAVSSYPHLLDQNYFMSADFDGLGEILNSLVNHTCAKQPVPPACDRMDLAFLLDRSGSICDDDEKKGEDIFGKTCGNWNKVRKFVGDIVSWLNVAPGHVHVALATFGSNGDLQFDFNEYSNKGLVLQAIEQVGFAYQNTNTAGGLKIIDNDVFSEAGGDRADVPNVLIVITDGVSTTDHNKTVPTAEDLRHKKHVDIISVGVTELIDEEELRLISSEPHVLGENYFMTADFGSLSDLLWSIVMGSCPEA